MLRTMVKVAVAGAAAVVAYKYLFVPWRARRAATKIVKVTGKVTGTTAMKEAVNAIVAQLAKMKVSASVGTGTHGGQPAVLVKPDNRALMGRLMDVLPDYVNGVRIAVVS